MAQQAEASVNALFASMGIEVNGRKPWDVQVHDGRFYARVLSMGSLGFGESYMDGWWDCEALDELVTRLFRGDIRSQLRTNLPLIRDALRARLMNRQAGARAYRIAQAHYDIGNDLYQAMLDQRMTYTCGYWSPSAKAPGDGPMTLDEAQEAKLDLVCRKIGLKAGQKVLDIGCGWGSFAKFAAEKYGAEVFGITVSREQVKLGRELCRGLPITVELMDYRDLNGSFDHVVSLGMIEHVGDKNYRTYFEVARRCLKDDGLFLLHTIGGDRSVHSTDPWVNKYIFPDSMLPSAAQLTRAFEGLFVMEDWHNFAMDYDRTLMAWHRNVEEHWETLKDRYDERFRRMWRFYLLASAGTFRARCNQLWQIVLSPHGVPGGYQSLR